MARRRFFVDCIDGDRATLEGQDAHHLARVLRAEPGQRYEITDGTALCLAEVETVTPRAVAFRIVEALDPGPPLPPIILIVSLFKFDRFEWMIEKVTELGVKAILPVESTRTDEGLFKAAAKRVERWRKIARESSQQSRRVRVPDIYEAVRLAKAPRFPTTIRLDENQQGPPLATLLQDWNRTDDLALAIGPEGGWTEHDRALLDCPAAGLGPTILRAETAAIATAVLATTMSW